MSVPPPLAPIAAALGDQALPVLETTVEQDHGPRSPTSPELIDRGLKRRGMLESSVFSPRSNAFTNTHASTPITGDATGGAGPTGNTIKSKWVPLPLKTPVLVVNIVLLVVIAITLEVLLKVNHDAYGWGTPSFYNKYPQIHVIWTYLPGILAFIIVHHWSEVDRYIKILQPYIDMSTKNVPAEKSILLNYVEQNKWLVWREMARNRHIVPLITNCLIILCIGMQPLFSSFLYLQQPPSDFVKPISNISVIEELGVQNPQPFLFTDAAAAFMQTSSLYDVSPPPFIRFLPAAAWTSTRIAIQTLFQDGTVKAHTVCLRSMVSCEVVEYPTLDTAHSSISGSSTNCSFNSSTQSVGSAAAIPFGMSTALCPSLQAPATPEMLAVAFWVLGGSNANSPVATICIPEIQVQRADVLLNTTTSALLVVAGQTPLLASDQNSNASLSSAPFNGSAFNGLFFSSLNGTGAAVNLNSTRFSLGQAIANLYKKNDTTLSNSSLFQAVVADAYAHYLGILAQSLYFQPRANTTTTGSLHLLNERLFVSAPVAHILCALLFVVAIFGTAILLLHREYSRQLQLTTEPGTLAASIALGASDVSYLLNGKDTKEDMRTMLADLQFTIDPQTGRLVVQEGEGGYSEFPRTYVPRSARLPRSPTGTYTGENVPPLDKPEVEQVRKFTS